MSGIPPEAKYSEVKLIAEAFGPLKNLTLVRDPGDESMNRGFCFFEYENEKITDKAIKGLNGMEIGTRRLRVQRANIDQKVGTIAAEIKQKAKEGTLQDKRGFTDREKLDIDYKPPPDFTTVPSRVIVFINMLSPEDVMDDNDYREILEDVRNEASKFGTLLNVEIPRPDKSTQICASFVGKVFVKFKSLQHAKKARYKISGRKFNNRTVVGSFYPENYFNIRNFNYSDDLQSY